MGMLGEWWAGGDLIFKMYCGIIFGFFCAISQYRNGQEIKT